jgi:hypothetical protein
MMQFARTIVVLEVDDHSGDPVAADLWKTGRPAAALEAFSPLICDFDRREHAPSIADQSPIFRASSLFSEDNSVIF